MQNITLKLLAKELNMSIATVSKALRDSYEISADTKEKVCALARKLNYQPNPSASNLRSQIAKTIAVIVPDVSNNFFSLAIKGIEEIARQSDYHVLIYQTYENCEKEIEFTNALLNGRVDGILISVSSNANNTEHFKELIRKIPIVFFDRMFDNIKAFQIITNDYQCTYDATCHLIESGCKKIAYLLALNTISTGKQRLMGYTDALKDHDLFTSNDLVLNCNQDEERNYERIRSCITNQKPDGIISSIEELALPCYYICQELGLNIPADLKILSFSNLSSAAFLSPSMTTITQPAFDIGKKAASILFKILSNKCVQAAETLILDSVLIKRDSTSNNRVSPWSADEIIYRKIPKL